MDRTESFITNLKEQNDVIWATLLGASCIHGDMERTRRAASHVLQVDPNNAATHMLLANAYAAAGKWKGHIEVRNEMVHKNIKKIPSATWVTIGAKSEMFYVDAEHMCLVTLSNLALFFVFFIFIYCGKILDFRSCFLAYGHK